jgi:S1-C subfamily serine protease
MKAVLINKDKDLVLLRIISSADGKPLPETVQFPTIPLGNSYHLDLLDDLAIIGFPEKGGSTVTVNTGIIEGKDILGDWLKTDARLIHGNSGGAAVDSQGRLVGIPTKVVVDSQEIDTNKDGFPDTVRTYGAVGFLRPVHLVNSMLDQLQALEIAVQPPQDSTNPPSEVPVQPTVTVRGLIKSKSQGSPIAGALIGLILLGSDEVTPENLLTWGGSDPEGRFELNKPVPPGSYTLKVKAIGYEPYNREISIKSNSPALIIELQPLH